MKTQMLLGALSVLALSAGMASAASPWPTIVVGRWNMTANQSSLVLTITSQGGVSTCRNITGTLVDAVNGLGNIVGYYCLDSGKISFTRDAPSNSRTYQVFIGNLSYTGSPTYMAGTFEQEVGPTPGEYEFFAQKAPN